MKMSLKESVRSTWRLDLEANSRRRGIIGAIIAWWLSPGFKAVTIYRLSRAARSYGPAGKLASQLLWRWCVASTGCYISPLARIGPGLALPHAVGVVVGEGVQLAANVALYQHVTLGRAREDDAVYPVVGEGVVIYAGAVIVGGVTLGANSIVGANAVVLRDIAPGATAVGLPAR